MAKKTNTKSNDKSTSTGSKKAGKKSGKGPDASPGRTLSRLEEKIVNLLQEHAIASLQVGTDRPLEADKRFAKLVSVDRAQHLASKKKGPLDDKCVQAIFRELVSAERALLQPIRVAYLGPAHSYSHLATLQHFGRSAELIPVGSIATVFEEVAQERSQWGVVPIENSTDGRIVDTLDMFTKMSVNICGEVPFPIHHNLLGSGTREEITEIGSKPQAISQCRDWLARHMPGAKLVSMSSTTAAAERAAASKHVAAIASHEAGVEYNLKVLAKNIEDNKHNVTRFAVIGGEPKKKTGNDKTSLMFELKHAPGALANAMTIFKSKKLNLTWIESFPKPDSPSEYLFFVELVGHQTESRVKRAIESLTKKTVRLEVLGSYPMGEQP